MMHNCEDCEMDGEEVPATEEWDTWGEGSGGLHLCKTCAERRQNAYEPDLNGWSASERISDGYRVMKERRH